MFKNLLCKMGIHKWSKPKYNSNFSSNVRDWSKYCQRCFKKKTWVESK